jgi:rifampicin phosphotransferase
LSSTTVTRRANTTTNRCLGRECQTSGMAESNVTWEAPGPGQWAIDRSHYPGGVTPLSQHVIRAGFDSGLARMAVELGAPIATIRVRFVNGFFYTRTIGLVGGDKAPAKLPPRFVLKAASRLHPEFRRRRATARASLASPPGPAIVRRWNTEIKPDIVAKNRAFASFNFKAATDDALAAHTAALLKHLEEMCEMHFWLHGYDLGPIARYIGFTKANDIATGTAVTALAGASPSTTEPKHQLFAIRNALGGRTPASLDQLRSQSPEAAALLDVYLADRHAYLTTRYDIDGLTLGEMPETILSSIVAAQAPVDDDGSAATATVRALVPAAKHAEFDGFLADAREVMDMRDDNGPTLIEWPVGIMRLTLLEVGRRLVANGRAERAEHALELEPAELSASLLGAGGGPGAAVLAERRRVRLALARLNPPLTLGPPEPPPPVGVLPEPLETLVQTIATAMAEMGMAGAANTNPLAGVGVGSASYRGRVRRSDSPEEAFELLEPGDVLVVRSTSPAFNSILAIAGAVVTADGGAMSHAAVLARELGIAGVIGASGALDLPDGAIVEVDPVAGVVRIISEPVSAIG